MKYLFITWLLCLSAAAQSALPNSPGSIWVRPLKDPAFYIGTADYTASAIADVHATTACEHSVPRGCYEAYPGHDRYGYVVPQILLVAGMSYGCSLMLSEHRRWRWACLAIPVGLSLIHWKDSRTIYRVDPIARR